MGPPSPLASLSQHANGGDVRRCARARRTSPVVPGVFCVTAVSSAGAEGTCLKSWGQQGLPSPVLAPTCPLPPHAESPAGGRAGWPTCPPCLQNPGLRGGGDLETCEP